MRTLLTIPAYNEEATLAATVGTLHDFIARTCEPGTVAVDIADNGSVDATASIGKELAAAYPEVSYRRIERAGKGLAIRQSWQQQGYDVYMFMDADLSTDLSVLPSMLGEMKSGSDIVIGSRLHPQSQVTRPVLRRVQTYVYNNLLWVLFGTSFSDAQIGCKAVSCRVRDALVGGIIEDGLFFDTHLLVMAERSGFQIRELPVTYRDERSGRIHTVKVSSRFLRKALTLRLALLRETFAEPKLPVGQ